MPRSAQGLLLHADDPPAIPPSGNIGCGSAQLAEHRIWMPGMAAGTEWASYYDELAAAFGLTIDLVGPVFGNEALLAEIADSPELATLVGERSRYLWPDSYDLRRMARTHRPTHLSLHSTPPSHPCARRRRSRQHIDLAN